MFCFVITRGTYTKEGVLNLSPCEGQLLKVKSNRSHSEAGKEEYWDKKVKSEEAFMTESDGFKGFPNPLVCLLETVTSEHLSSDVIGKKTSRFYSFEFLLSKTVIIF